MSFLKRILYKYLETEKNTCGNQRNMRQKEAQLTVKEEVIFIIISCGKKMN